MLRLIQWHTREHSALAAHAARWLLIAAPVSAVIGSACALFLSLLDSVTAARLQHPWLLYLLPLAGVGMVWVYARAGDAERGNNLIMEEIHKPGAGVPAYMAPLILLSTLASHLFGGSVGREGTAVQMGGSIASTFSRVLKLSPDDTRKLLMVGVAAGFGGVFGTPLAGAIFALEVLAIGRISYEALFPCLIAGIIGDQACRAWGIHHTHFHVAVGQASFAWITAGKVLLAAIAFGLASMLFCELSHFLGDFWRRAVPRRLLRPVMGGCVIILLTFVLGTRDYLGLGNVSADGGVSIASSFSPGGASALSWFWKLLFTAITLSSGFKGGEVTPLFFMGATLGNALGTAMGEPVDLFAALGFVAIFAGASNTPLASTLLGVELFGSEHVVYIALACFVAYLFSGHSSIYLAQRVGTSKLGPRQGSEATLEEIREERFATRDEN